MQSYIYLDYPVITDSLQPEQAVEQLIGNFEAITEINCYIIKF
jgi:hypothetical protein